MKRLTMRSLKGDRFQLLQAYNEVKLIGLKKLLMEQIQFNLPGKKKIND